jgi:hypothetical protein
LNSDEIGIVQLPKATPMSLNVKIAPGPTRLSEGNELVKVSEELEIERPPPLKIWELMSLYIKMNRTAKV